MSQLTNLIKKSQFAIEKNLISEKEIRYFFENDPTPNKNMAKFMCYVYINNSNLNEYIVRDFFDRYNELGKLKDKYNFKLEPLDKLVKEGFLYFKQYIKNLESDIDKKIKEKEKNKQKTSEYKILDENSDWVAIETLTVEANQKFGSDSDWCTRQSGYFNRYSNQDTKLITFINKKLQKKYTKESIPKEERNPEYKLQAQIKREGRQIKNKVFIDCETFLNLFDRRSKNFSTFDDLLNKIKINPAKLLDSLIENIEFNEIVEFQSIDESEFWLLERIKNPILNKETGLLDCEEIDWEHLNLTSLPKTIKLGVVKKFDCSDNKITSLEGAPKEVGGNFDCSSNRLTSLEGAPEKVDGYFYCPSNRLTSLEGAPKEVGGIFACSHNQLTSLKGAPRKIGRNFQCSFNDLTSLEGAPERVENNFHCYNNRLTSFKGFPDYVGGGVECVNNYIVSFEGISNIIYGNFNCAYNRIISFEGAPKKIGGDFNCSFNKLTSLEGVPKEIGGDFIYFNNPFESVKK